MTRRAEQMAQRRHRILEAAREIMADEGFDGLTVRDLAEASGVTVPTIYNLVGGKDQVLVAAVAEQTAIFVRGIQRASGDVMEIVEANLRELLRMPRYYRSLLILFMTSEVASPPRTHVARAVRVELRAAVGELAEEGGIEDWVDLGDLTRQIHMVLEGRPLAWANEWITDDDLVRQVRLGVALLLLGVTRGETRETYLRIARENQGPPAAPSGDGAAAKVTSLKGRRRS